jgi:hypothetical protein
MEAAMNEELNELASGELDMDLDTDVEEDEDDFEPEERDIIDDSMDGDHESALESVYGPCDDYGSESDFDDGCFDD